MKNKKVLVLSTLVFFLALAGSEFVFSPYFPKINIFSSDKSIRDAIHSGTQEIENNPSVSNDNDTSEPTPEQLFQDPGEEKILQEDQTTLKEEPILPLSEELPEAIDENPGLLKIGFVTDLHVRTTLVAKGVREINPKFINKIRYFNKQMAELFVPDFVVINGDVIEGTRQTAATGALELKACKKEFDLTDIPEYWVLGNHDLRAVTKKQWMNALKIDYTRISFESGNYKVIILDSNFDAFDNDISPERDFTRGNVSKKELDWLETELKSTDKKKIVFLHHPPLTSLHGIRSGGMLYNAPALQQIFSENKVTAVFSGHIEKLYHEQIDGVLYYVLPGIAKHIDYQGAFATIEIRGSEVAVKLTYLENDGDYETIDVK